MKRNNQSIDGFVPRKKVGSVASNQVKKPVTPRRKPTKVDEKSDEAIEKALENLTVYEDDYSDKKRSRKSVSKNSSKWEKKLQKFNKKREKKGKKTFEISRFKRRVYFRRALFLTIVLVISFGGYKIWKSSSDTLKIFGGGGSIFNLVEKKRLKSDSDGRTNILVFGTSPEGWDGEDLADSIMLVSANQDTKKVYTVSLPRDLWVKHSCSGWLGTTAGKLNESYGCGKLGAGKNSTPEEAEKLGQNELAEAVSNVTGLDIHYKVHGNWQVLVGAIDAIGGIDVKVEVYDGSPEMYDYATKVRYKNGEVAHMNGERALAFSRARGAHGGYGLSGGNFDRERNQQKIIKATVEKINSSGKYNPGALLSILESFGNNIRTSFETSEIQTVLDLAKEFQGGNVKSLPLVDTEDGDMFKTGMVASASVVLPSAGTYEYSQIQKYIAKNTKSGDVVSENAKIVILNGTDVNGLAAEAQQKLSKDGFNVVDIDSASKTDYKNSKLYDISKKSPATIKKLEQKYKTSSEDLPNDLMKYKDAADILLILGEE